MVTVAAQKTKMGQPPGRNIINGELQATRKTMSTRKLAQLLFAAALLAEPLFAQQKGDSSACMAEYENHNQIDYGPLIVQEVEGMITDPQQVAVPKVCVGIFTQKEHKVVRHRGNRGRGQVLSAKPSS